MANIFSEISDSTPVLSSEVSTGLFSPDEAGTLSNVYTGSYQKAISGEYYYDLYHSDPASAGAEVQFAVAYGHVSGGGSPPVDESVLSGNSLLPTQAIYSQYRNVLLTSGSLFTFGTTQSNDIYVINFNRSRTKQTLDPGNWQLALRGLNSATRTFIDSSELETTTYNNVIASNYYNVVSGSLDGLNGSTKAGDTVYGVVFPDYGTIILHPAAISQSVGFTGSFGSSNKDIINQTVGGQPFAPYTGSAATAYQYQHEALYRAIKKAMTEDATNGKFVARSLEKVSSKNYSVFLKYNEYNYTNNPTSYYVADGIRQILPRFRNNPTTYITTIGLYNNNNELVAVAKLSRPLEKSKSKAALIRVRLDY
jgi:hypothetical protein